MAKKKSLKEMEPLKIVMTPVEKDDDRYVHCRVLIVCEGEKTEPFYFNSFGMMRNNSSFVFEITPGGGGINTMNVVDEAIRRRNEAMENDKPFDSVWAVFDRDSFDPSLFDNAICRAEANGINCAWSNEAFELWYVYHFDDRNTAMSRQDYERIITDRVRSRGMKGFSYEKKCPDMRHVLSECGCDERLAIRLAERQAMNFLGKAYHDQNPCTMVYKLVRLLIGEDKEFNKQVKKVHR